MTRPVDRHFGVEFGPAVNDAEDPVNKLGELVNLVGRFLSYSLGSPFLLISDEPW